MEHSKVMLSTRNGGTLALERQKGWVESCLLLSQGEVVAVIDLT